MVSAFVRCEIQSAYNTIALHCPVHHVLVRRNLRETQHLIPIPKAILGARFHTLYDLDRSDHYYSFLHGKFHDLYGLLHTA
jgi:hypothetical protein